MTSVEFFPITTQGGYGYKSRQISQKDGPQEDSSAAGASLSGEISAGFFAKGEDYEESGRIKGGLALATAKVDSLVGTAHDDYLRFTLNYGFHYKGEADTKDFRFYYESGITGRYDYNKVTLTDGKISGGTHSITLPLGIGVGGRGLLVGDRVEFGIGFPASFRLKNTLEANYRVYANYDNRSVYSIEVFANYQLEMGRLTNEATEFSHFVLGGLRFGILDLGIRK